MSLCFPPPEIPNPRDKHKAPSPKPLAPLFRQRQPSKSYLVSGTQLSSEHLEDIIHIQPANLKLSLESHPGIVNDLVKRVTVSIHASGDL